MGLQQEEARKVAANGAVVERVVRYMECRKNHAASVGGYAVDGCREFMASGADGTADALRCAACGCHRSFHRREVQTLPSLYASSSSSSSSSSTSSTSRR